MTWLALTGRRRRLPDGRGFQSIGGPDAPFSDRATSNGPASMTELAQSHRMTLPSFAQHLRVLEQSGLLQSAKQGRERRYRLVPTRLIMAEDWLGKQRAIWEQRLDRLESYVEGMKKRERDGVFRLAQFHR